MNVEPISPHTMKKFELVAGYVEAWKEILLLNTLCEELIFIDCMSNRGEYTLDGQKVFGTPVRVDKLLRRAAEKRPDKNISVIFNDISAGKIEHLKTLIPEGTRNYHVRILQ